jgi:hypothetical protein
VAATYFDIPEAAQRIRDHNVKCRIIITLRDPVARSFSLYLHHKKMGRLNCDFREAIKQMPRIIDSSHYRKHIKRWTEVFGSEQILIILLEEISASPERVLERTYEFLEINKVRAPASAWKQVNAASLPASPVLASLLTRGSHWLRERRLYGPIELAKNLGLKRIYAGPQDNVPRLEAELRQQLVEEFSSDIAYVEELFGRSLPQWRCCNGFGRPFEHRVQP